MLTNKQKRNLIYKGCVIVSAILCCSCTAVHDKLQTQIFEHRLVHEVRTCSSDSISLEDIVGEYDTLYVIDNDFQLNIENIIHTPFPYGDFTTWDSYMFIFVKRNEVVNYAILPFFGHIQFQEAWQSQHLNGTLKAKYATMSFAVEQQIDTDGQARYIFSGDSVCFVDIPWISR